MISIQEKAEKKVYGEYRNALDRKAGIQSVPNPKPSKPKADPKINYDYQYKVNDSKAKAHTAINPLPPINNFVNTQ
jgi:hypothetical protein